MDRLHFNRRYSAPYFFAVLFTALLATMITAPRPALAGMLLDAELRLSYEDNVVGQLSDQGRGQGGAATGAMMGAKAPGMGGMGGGVSSQYTGTGSQSPGDFSATVSAEAGAYRDVSDNASLFVKAFASQLSYSRYTDFDTTIGGVTGGVTAGVTRDILAKGAVFGKVKRFGDSQRNSTAFGVNASLKERLDPSFWLREFGEIERNDADNAVFSYTGLLIGIEGGYSVTRQVLLSLGLSILDQGYDQPSGASLETQTLYVSVERELNRSWSLSGEYDLQVSTANSTGRSATDDIFSVALRYAY